VLGCRRLFLWSDASIIKIFQESQIAGLRDRKMFVGDKDRVIPKSRAKRPGIGK